VSRPKRRFGLAHSARDRAPWNDMTQSRERESVLQKDEHSVNYTGDNKPAYNKQASLRDTFDLSEDDEYSSNATASSNLFSSDEQIEQVIESETGVESASEQMGKSTSQIGRDSNYSERTDNSDPTLSAGRHLSDRDSAGESDYDSLFGPLHNDNGNHIMGIRTAG
ncbi:MAG: hypothetical protein Q9160_009302, partial [Pyrenula sp. 1 TL-2023]